MEIHFQNETDETFPIYVYLKDDINMFDTIMMLPNKKRIFNYETYDSILFYSSVRKRHERMKLTLGMCKVIADQGIDYHEITSNQVAKIKFYEKIDIKY